MVGLRDASGVGATLAALGDPGILVPVEAALRLGGQPPVHAVVDRVQLVIEPAKRRVLADRRLVGVMRIAAVEALRAGRVRRREQERKCERQQGRRRGLSGNADLRHRIHRD